mmetsp:Transcript_23055/g.49919  ORF Transcript_23055/g.49919 Transcript_23055/m.49919 type:complete len:281 (-) Transcript_23055:143-985(-)
MSLYNFAALVLLTASAANAQKRRIKTVEADAISNAEDKGRLDNINDLSMSLGTTAEDEILADTTPQMCSSPAVTYDCPVPSPTPADHDHLNWWPDLLDPYCHVKGKECNGHPYYLVQTNTQLGIPVQRSWTAYNHAAPKNCALAGVGSPEEFKEIQQEFLAQRSGIKLDYGIWIGISKSFADVACDNDGGGSKANWHNPDGTPAAVCADTGVWGSFGGSMEPDNLLKKETYAVLSGPNTATVDPNELLLFDLPNFPKYEVPGAMYKCCGEVFTFPSCKKE